MIETTKYVRKSFPVDAIQVQDSNMDEVAEWCSGVVENDGHASYIKVDVHNPMNERQTKAFHNDWILYAGTGFKVYPDTSFQKSFEMVPVKTKVEFNRRATD
jgi:hypothetical protein